MTPWFKLSVNAVRHPKVKPLKDRAFRWWVEALSYATEYLTDGVLPSAFWKRVPQPVRAEFIEARLWEWDDPNFLIHDYLDYQSSRESVMRKKADAAGRVARHRARPRNAVTGTESNADSNALVTRPDTDNRDQTQNSDSREQRQQENASPPPLIKSPASVEKRKKHCAFVGVRLEVPHGLHAELQKRHGGANADAELKSWYATVDAEITASGEAITPNEYKWLKAKYGKWRGAAIGDRLLVGVPARESFTDEERTHALEVHAQVEAENAQLDEEAVADYWRKRPWAKR